ncbi:MAG: hypothetical protein EPO28_14335 [Saprospiraceae bacterium]|nr:MAG: hypothetical protein EPO28_14335 [Saprospiraceae bacterium]
MWEIESIPDETHLFYRLHKSFIVEGEVLPGAFQERGEGNERGMSTDWAKYSTAGEALHRSKAPHENAIVQFHVGKIRSLPSLEVVHAPMADNRAHCHIKGIPHERQLKTQVRFLLKRSFKWCIEPEDTLLTKNDWNF